MSSRSAIWQKMDTSKQTVQKKGKELEQIVRRIEELILSSDRSLQSAELIFESNKFITVNGVRHEIDLHVQLWSGDKIFKAMKKQLGPDFLKTSIGRAVEEIGKEFYSETGSNEVLCDDAVDFFYDALFEQKRRGLIGSGVILSTAHKVKGLEFNNVTILDGPWVKNIRNVAELEEARRLYYVAVTRARKSLTICRLQNSNTPFIEEVPEGLIHKSAAAPELSDPDLLEYHYDIISLEEIYLSYAANDKLTSHESRALAKCRIGDTVYLKAETSKNGEAEHIYVVNQRDIKLARLSKQGTGKWLPRLDKVEQVKITCLHKRLRQDGNGDNRSANRSWLVPVLEVLWKANQPCSALKIESPCSVNIIK